MLFECVIYSKVKTRKLTTNNEIWRKVLFLHVGVFELLLTLVNCLVKSLQFSWHHFWKWLTTWAIIDGWKRKRFWEVTVLSLGIVTLPFPHQYLPSPNKDWSPPFQGGLISQGFFPSVLWCKLFLLVLFLYFYGFNNMLKQQQHVTAQIGWDYKYCVIYSGTEYSSCH